MRTPRARTRADGSVVWQVNFRHHGRQTSQTFPRAADARRWAKLMDEQGIDAALDVLAAWRTVDSETPHTVTTFAAEHVDSLTGVGEAHRKRCRAYIRNDLRAFEHTPIGAVTEDAVKKWINDLERAGASGKTIRNKHGFLSSVMSHALAAGLAQSNPCKGLRLPRTVREPMTFLTPDEFRRFVEFFTPHWQPMVWAMFGTGMRFSEITALTVGDVDLVLAVARVTKSWHGDVTGPPKSEKAVRNLALAPELVEILRPLVVGRPADALVFANTAGDRVRASTFHDNVWGPAVNLANGLPAQGLEPRRRKGVATTAANRAGRRRAADGERIAPASVPLGKRPRPHDARHSCASWLLAQGAPLNVVQDFMGHESIVTTTRLYGHLLPSAQAAVRGALSWALTGGHEIAAPTPLLLPAAG